MLISVIIPAFNEEKVLGQTIERINHALNENIDKGYSWEIIVCDNNSTDRTAEVALQRGGKVVIERISNISRARNSGARVAKGNWLLFIDADSYPRPELIAEVIAVIEDGNYIGCATTIWVEEGTLFNKLRLERMNPIFRLFGLCGGAFILCQKEAFRSIEGFSNSLYAFEEIDFVIRLKKYGRKRGKQFIVLHHFPVITSGRKGEYRIFSIVALIVSNFIAVVLFILHYFLPREISVILGRRSLGYWYESRR